VLDFGVMLKLNDGNLGCRALLKMLHILIALKAKYEHDYNTSIIMQLLIVLYQKKQQTVSWQMLKDNLSVFNEEVGEMAFSVLARCVLGDGLKNKFEHLNDMYTLLHTYRELSDDIADDMDKTGPRASWRKRIDPEGEEATATLAWLKMCLRRIRHNKFTVYNGKASSYKDAAAAATRQITRPDKPVAWRPAEHPGIFDELIVKARKRFMDTDWGWGIREVWPEFDHIIPSEHAVQLDIEDLDSPDSPMGDEPVEAVAEEPDGKSSEKRLVESDDELLNGGDDGVEGDASSASEEEAKLPACRAAAKVYQAQSRDKDELGQDVNWKAWGCVSTGNIRSVARSDRRQGARRDVSSTYPFVNTQTPPKPANKRRKRK
jgi:hypothetical protein